MKRDDLKFIASFAATVVMAGVVIYSAYWRDMRAAAGPTVDIEWIEAMAEKGIIGLDQASHWEAVEEVEK